MSGIPSAAVKAVIEEWIGEYGPTFPLYGSDTVRHDISGSVRPLLSSTEIPHIRILAEATGISKRTLAKIMSGEKEEVTHEVVDTLLAAMGKTEEWHFTLAEWY